MQHHSRVGAGRGRGVFLKSKLCIFIYMPALDRSISVIAGDGGGDGGAAGVSKNHESCIKNEKLCIKNEELCIKNDVLCRAVGSGKLIVAKDMYTGGSEDQVSFQWKNPDLLLKNPDLLLKHVDFIINETGQHDLPAGYILQLLYLQLVRFHIKTS